MYSICDRRILIVHLESNDENTENMEIVVKHRQGLSFDLSTGVNAEGH
jgi:hypothetical protein